MSKDKIPGKIGKIVVAENIEHRMWFLNEST